MNRRDFIKGTAALAAAQGIAPYALAAEEPQVAPPLSSGDEQQPLITSAPVLQNYAAESMGVAFGVSALANGYVVVGQQPDLSDGRKVYCGGFRQTGMDEDVIHVRLTGLQPDTTYYYRIGADRIDFKGGYDIHITSTEEDPHIHSFRTAGPRTPAHFCVINDTHAQWAAFGAAINKIAELRPACVVWNGDACNTEEELSSLKEIYLTPPIDHAAYAADTPYLFCPGNHDLRGRANRPADRLWMFRQPEERGSRDWDLGRNFAVRMGDVALVGLDTGEDKQDTNPRFCHLFVSQPYRRAQQAWLRDALARPDIASAPFLVALCHIPLFDPRTDSNPGDVEPDDTDPQYKTTFAMWQRTCAQLWAPLLEAAGCQLVIAAHQHRHRFHPATPDRPWAELLGGGPDMDAKSKTAYPTVIEGMVLGGQLAIVVHDVLHGVVAAEHTFAPRKVKRQRRR